MTRVESRILKGGPGLPDKIAAEPLLLVPENNLTYREVKRYPSLVNGEERVKCNPLTGELYISSWHEKRKEEAVNNTQDEVVLYRRGEEPETASASRWSKLPDIETAIRSVSHVLEKYNKEGGETVSNTKDVARLIGSDLSRFKSPDLVKNNLPELAREAQDRLLQAGFIHGRKPIKQEIAQRIARALSKDSKGRYNPLISRTILASVWLKVTRELLFDRSVRNKYSTLLTTLSHERNFERFCLEQASETMRELGEMSSQDREFGVKIRTLKEYAARYLLPGVIKAAPYRRPAVLSLATLFGARTEKGKNLVKAMFKDDPQKAEEILARTPIDQLLSPEVDRKAAVEEIRARVGLARELIDTSLKTGDQKPEKN